MALAPPVRVTEGFGEGERLQAAGEDSKNGTGKAFGAWRMRPRPAKGVRLADGSSRLVRMSVRSHNKSFLGGEGCHAVVLSFLAWPAWGLFPPESLRLGEGPGGAGKR